MMNMMIAKSMIEAKLGKKGVAIVEYAVLLAFVALVGTVILKSGDAGLAGAVQTKITKVVEMLTTSTPAA